jgi:hypothetical protein
VVATAEEDRLNARAQSIHFFCGILGDTKVRVLINAQIAAGYALWKWQQIPSADS